MQFLYPQFLYAFLTLLIPILIHLFYFRRFKTVYFSNVRFLSQLREERQTRSRLKNWLVLLSRLLIFSCLILAFAQPYFPSEASGSKPGKDAISIFIDNSFSMRSVGEEGNLIETAKKKAREITESYREGDEYQLLTNDFKVENQQFSNRADLSKKLESVKSSPNTKSLATVLDRQGALLRDQDASRKIAFIISDFQKSTNKLRGITTDSNITYYFVPLKANKKDNVFIDSAWLASPTIQINQNNQLNYRVKNSGKEPVEELTVKLSVNKKQKGLDNINIPANQSKTGKILFQVDEKGWNAGKLSIKDYPITFDDNLFISYPVKNKARILAINEENKNPYLETGYGTDDYFGLTNRQAGNLDYSSLNRYDFIILNEHKELSSGLVAELTDFLEQGGNVLLLPPSDYSPDLKPYSSLLKRYNANRFKGASQEGQEVSYLNFDHPIFQDVFEEIPDNVRLPKVNQFYQSSDLAKTQERVLMRLKNGQSLLSIFPYRQGNVFVSAIPFNKEWSNITQNAIFVPLIYKMAFYEDKPRQLAYTISQDQILEVSKTRSSSDQVFKLMKDNYEVIPPQKQKGSNWRLFINDQIPEAGIYKLMTQSQAEPTGEGIAKRYAFNYNRKESQMATHSESELKDFTRKVNAKLLADQYKNLSQTIQQIEKGQFLWKTFIWLALAFLVVEIFLLKFLP